MKRFYKEVSIAAAEDGHRILLDDRPIRTPGRAVLALGSSALAEAVAGEWRAAGEEINPANLLLTQLANTEIDRVRPDRPAIIAALLRYADTDLVRFRAPEPAELVARQSAAWDPAISHFRDRAGILLSATTGLSLPPLEPPQREKLQALLDEFSPSTLTALQAATASLGSLLLALQLIDGVADAGSIFTAAHLDELFQLERWGEDGEAAARLAAIRQEVEAAARYVRLA